MLVLFAAEVGRDSAKVADKCKKLCEGKPLDRVESKYGEGLLLATQKCGGDRLCTLIVQGAFKRCYMAGA
jgi:hypothetical protein